MATNGADFQMRTKKGYDFFLCASTIQKAIRRGDEQKAIQFVVEMYESGFDEYVWKRLKIITSEDVGLGHPNMPAIIQSLYQMYLDQKKKKDEKHRPERLFLVHAVILLSRAKKSRLVDWTLIKHWTEYETVKLEIPDYAFDKHNKEGRKMGRGIDHFYKDGTVLNPYADITGEPEMKQAAYDLQSKKKESSADQAEMFG